MQNVSDTDKVLGRSSSGAGDVEEIPCTSTGRSVLAAANAAVAGLSHVDARAGDLFAPVEGMTFDRIVCQPPFMPASGGASVVGVTRTGGSRGDELPLRAMAESVRHLAPGGRAIFAVNWVIVDDEPIMDRVRAAVGPEPDILVIDIGDLAPATLAGIDCEVAAGCARGGLALCLHPGGHEIRAEWLDAALGHLGWPAADNHAEAPSR